MQFELSQNSQDLISADIALVFLFAASEKNKNNFKPLGHFQSLDKSLNGLLSKVIEIEKFDYKKGSMISVVPSENILPSRIVIMSLGEKNQFSANTLRQLIAGFVKKFKNSIDSVSLVLPEKAETGIENNHSAKAIVEGIMLGNYEFLKYKKKDQSEHVLSTVLISIAKEPKYLEKVINHARTYSNAVILARDLVNEQPATATPTFLADLAVNLAKSNPQIKCKVYDKKEIEEMGMNAFLGIARASDIPPKFIHLTYTPKTKSTKIISLVGKGITFDSGGINVKPGDSMKDMKMDMSGAAVVLAVFSALKSIQPKAIIHGFIAATPNLISGNSLVPGDVVKSMNGKTIEVLNTDAEGRVTMADSLSFAVKLNSDVILDFATLTGACMVALGADIAGLFSNDQDLADAMKKSADDEGELVWQLPLPNEYKELNKSDVADIANIPSSRYGGAITAALFLQEFIDKKSWMHLDIAGPAFTSKSQDLSVKGGTGFGVRLTLNYLESIN